MSSMLILILELPGCSTFQTQERLPGSLVEAGVSNYLSTIRFKTRNCGGIGGLEKKRRQLFDNLRHNNDVIVLTETKFKQSKEDTYRQEWNSGMYNSCTTEDRAQAGVSILFGRDLDITIHEKDHGSDSEGRMVWVKGELRSKIILFVSRKSFDFPKLQKDLFVQPRYFSPDQPPIKPGL